MTSGVTSGVSETRAVMPRIEAEALPAPRLEPMPLVAEPVPRERWGMPALVLAGATVLILGLAAIETGNLVADEFARSAFLGGATAGIALTGFGLIGAGFWRELSALSALRSVDRLRRALTGTNDVQKMRAARTWVASLPEAAVLLPAIDAINDPDAVTALLRTGPAASFRVRAEVLGRAAAIQSVAGIAAMPSPGLAAVFVAWRGVRLVRQVAALHGMRPGLLATLGLLRRTALAAGAVAGVEMATNAAAHAVLSSGLVSQMAGEMAGAGVAARRMIVLARAASVACSPLPEL